MNVALTNQWGLMGLQSSSREALSSREVRSSRETWSSREAWSADARSPRSADAEDATSYPTLRMMKIDDRLLAIARGEVEPEPCTRAPYQFGSSKANQEEDSVDIVVVWSDSEE